MSSEHHWLDEMFLKDLMFDNFKAKAWSDGKDEIDLEYAKENYENEDCGSFEEDCESAVEFANLWIEDYYVDYGFDYGLLTFEVKEWGDDGLNSRYYEVEFYLDNKPFQTLTVKGGGRT